MSFVEPPSLPAGRRRESCFLEVARRGQGLAVTVSRLGIDIKSPQVLILAFEHGYRAQRCGSMERRERRGWARRVCSGQLFNWDAPRQGSAGTCFSAHSFRCQLDYDVSSTHLPAYLAT